MFFMQAIDYDTCEVFCLDPFQEKLHVKSIIDWLS